MSLFKGIVEIINVWPGAIGGAIFSARPINSNKTLLVEASYKVLRTLPQKGEYWNLQGTETFDKANFMKKINASNCFLRGLPSKKFLANYLIASPRFRGFNFGAKSVEKLINKIGDEGLLIELMSENKWQHIAEVISETSAKRLCEEWIKATNETSTVEFLVEHNFDPRLSQKILKLCKGNTVDRLKHNPYLLLAFDSLSKNIFTTIELCAAKLNIGKNDPRRLIGGVEYVMYEHLKVGHTAIAENELFEKTTKLLGSLKRAKQATILALEHRVLCKFIENNGNYYQAIGPALIEHNFEKRLAKLNNGKVQESLFDLQKSSLIERVQTYNQELESVNGYSLVEGQVKAVSMALLNRCSIISGYGGTGKTTVLKAIVDIAKELGIQVYLMALSGKAKERIKHTTGHEATTIHTFIKSAKQLDLSCDPLVIIDEASMVDVSLFNRLLKLFDNHNYRLLTVGDVAQLSPVGFGLAWHKMVDSTIPTTHLTQVHRQALRSPLHKLAMNIRDGEAEAIPEWKGQNEGVFFVSCDKKLLRKEIVKLKSRMPDAQVLTPHMKEGLPDSGIALNKDLQASLNNELAAGWSDNRSGFRVGRYFIKEGDPVLVTENNYELGLFNGTLGKLQSIEKSEEGSLVGIFRFDNSASNFQLTIESCYEIGLTLAYAISVHKSQGSEFDQTIITCAVNSDFVERSMMYTALTRTKKLCILIGDRDVYRRAVNAPKRADTLCTGLEIAAQ